MCSELNALRKSIVTYATGFDARELTPGQAGEVVKLCAQMEASIASVKALAAARAAQGDTWKQDGYRSAADQLAGQTGISPSSARRTLAAGKRMSKQPEVAQAALAGELSPEQAAAVSDGAAADPAKTQELIDKAKSMSVPELNEEIARTKAAATDLEARRQAIRARRYLRRWTDRDGAFHAHLLGLPEHGAGMWQALDPIRRRLNHLRRSQGTDPDDSFEALDYDALLAMTQIALGREDELTLGDLVELGLFPQLQSSTPPDPTSPSGPPFTGGPVATPPEVPDVELFPDPALGSGSHGLPAEPTPASDPPNSSRRRKLAGSPIRVTVLVDLDTLLRGYPIDGETCEIAGYGPIPVSAIHDLMAYDNVFVVGALTKAKRVIGTYHQRRRPNAHQKSGLDTIYPSCAVAGCHARIGLQYDHRADWSKTHYTVFDLLDRLCAHHHALKTREGWQLVQGTGKRAFVAPTDRRHPSFSRRDERQSTETVG